ncbi:MAG: hypothetical protein HW380_3408 [Magnetococcales bacterium]|nr:hypothetical protein [Magnetococcales bacterium]HIJ83171.1 hypothetical protein [Magnetococcales bacterium]
MTEIWNLLYGLLLILFYGIVLILTGRIGRLLLIAIWRGSLISAALVVILSRLVTVVTSLAKALFPMDLLRLPFQPYFSPEDPRCYRLTSANRRHLQLMALVFTLVPTLILCRWIFQERQMLEPPQQQSSVAMGKPEEQVIPKETVPAAAKTLPEQTDSTTMKREPEPSPLHKESPQFSDATPKVAVEPTVVPAAKSETATSDPDAVTATPSDQKPANLQPVDPPARRIAFQTPNGIMEGTVELHKYGSFLIRLDGGGKKWVLEKDVVNR